jgi:broad specificity phosphatase PhoE
MARILHSSFCLLHSIPMATPAHFPKLVLVRHGETAWSRSRQHTGRTDIPLTPDGEAQARSLGPKLAGWSFGNVFTSPLQRAKRTCELAGFGGRAVDEPDLMEWDYGRYDGVTTRDIHKSEPGWNVFDRGCAHVGGESVEQIAARMDGLIARLRKLEGDTLCFAHAHAIRALTARWLGLPIVGGKLFVLGVATVSVLGYEHDLSEPVIVSWNA